MVYNVLAIDNFSGEQLLSALSVYVTYFIFCVMYCPVLPTCNLSTLLAILGQVTSMRG